MQNFKVALSKISLSKSQSIQDARTLTISPKTDDNPLQNNIGETINKSTRKIKKLSIGSPNSFRVVQHVGLDCNNEYQVEFKILVRCDCKIFLFKQF